MEKTKKMVRTLKQIAMLTGFAMLAISIYFSYDGFDQGVNGGNDGYTLLATVIGITLALVVSVVQFIFGTSYSELNWTLRLAGIAAYAYSIYTNYLGVKHILGADDFMAWASALFMDIYPEPAIAWALGEALTGDLIGNIVKIFFGEDEKKQDKRPEQNHPQRPLTYPPVHFAKGQSNPKKKHHPVQRPIPRSETLPLSMFWERNKPIPLSEEDEEG